MFLLFSLYSLFFFNDTAPTEIYTLSLHDALPISACTGCCRARSRRPRRGRSGCTPGDSISIPEYNPSVRVRSEEHTSELQSRRDLVCRLLLEKKNKIKTEYYNIILKLNYILILHH